MKSKTFSSLKACLLLTSLIPVTGAWAEFAPPHFNASPTVQIVSPYAGQAIIAGDNVQLCAAALYFTDKVASVEFFAGTNALGAISNNPSAWGLPIDLYCLTWSNVTTGTYSLTAVATDASGASFTSAAVDVSVVSNLPPRVQIISPREDEVLLHPTNLDICASAYDPDGTVVSVQFFAGTNSLGLVPTLPTMYETDRFGIFPLKSPYCVTWSNVLYGSFILTAVATANDGDTATSSPVTVSIVSNLPPRVHIQHPEEGAAYLAPADVDICVAASESGGSVASVEILAGTNSLGVLTTPMAVTNSHRVEDLYCLVWSNAPAGAYALTAVATGTNGLTGTSAPVKITVYPPPAPSVRITTPVKGSTIYRAPVNIEVCASERHFTNPIVSVQFFAGTNSLGVATNSPHSCILWSQAPPGAYTLTAVATEGTSTTVTSAPVNITVVTNRPGRHKDW
jgi:hypothetical protein